MTRNLRLATLSLLVVGTAAQADIVNFGKGSLIIPMQANFQTPCGSLAAYGLVYRILEGNATGGYFDLKGKHVTLYWTVNGSKKSPNRCIPTNLNTAPDGTHVTDTGSPGYNDGCDFSVSNSLDQPVVPVDFSVDPWIVGKTTRLGLFDDQPVPMRTPGTIGLDPTRVPGSGTQYVDMTVACVKGCGAPAPVITGPPIGTAVGQGTPVTVTGTGKPGSKITLSDSGGAIKTKFKVPGSGNWSVTFTPSGVNESSSPANWYIDITGGLPYAGWKTPESIPTYVGQTLSGSTFTEIQYMGGPFVIDATDAQNVIEYLENGSASTKVPLAVGALGQTTWPLGIADVLAEFTGHYASYATLKARTPTTSVGAGGFFDQCTGPLLVENGVRPDGTAVTTDHYVAIHQSTNNFSASVARRINIVPPKVALIDSESNLDSTGSPSVSGLQILDSYLGNAGLYFVQTTANNDSGGCPANTQSACNTNGKKPGFIYDKFDADADLVTQTGYADGILGSVNAAKQLIYGVLWTPHWDATHADQPYPYFNGGGPGSGINGLDNIATFLGNRGTGLMGECASIGSYEGIAGGGIATPQTNFLFSNDVVNNGLSVDDIIWDGDNCTDPNYTPTNPGNITAACTTIGTLPCGSSATSGSNGECVYWDNNSSEFSQIGDFHFVKVSGAVDDFKPDNTVGSTYNPGVLVLATTMTNYKPGDYPNSSRVCDPTATDGSCDERWDIFDLGRLNNDVNKAMVVYVAGHDYQISTVGSRIILNTLLNLGQQPISSDRSLSAPTVYADPNGATDSSGAGVGPSDAGTPLLFSAVYDVVSGVSSSRYTYSWTNGSQWLFPKTPGNIYEQPLVNVGSVTAFGQGSQAFNIGALWDAQGQMAKAYSNLAGNRNLFTYFGGTVTQNGAYRNGYLQTGWKPSPVKPAEVSNVATCVDVLKWGKVQDGKHPAYFGMIPGTDGVCDLEEATQLIPLVAGADFGVSEAASNKSLLLASAALDQVKGMIEVVDGYCFATVGGSDGTGAFVLPTSTANCNNQVAPVNNPFVGGFIHSQPAIVPFSPNIADAAGKRRPTMMYAAGADGQLHAFYVSGGTGYTGTAGTLHYPNSDASSVFNTSWLPFTTPPNPLTELWSFMPASQLPLLSQNDQMVDSAPVVQDVFADFGSTGIREWHTVVVATAGAPLGNPGAEVFALDVSNPLKPVLLWDLLGSWTAGSSTGTVTPVALANLFDGGSPSLATDWVQTSYPSVSCGGTATPYPAVGSSLSGIYDFSDLGSSYGLSLGQLNINGLPNFYVFLSSNLGTDAKNCPMNNGTVVYAIDMATGQKVWEWEEPYASSGTTPGNPVPQPVTLLGGPSGAINWVYANDLEGRMWELTAATGANPTDGGAGGSGAIFKTTGALEPLTTPVAIARLPGPSNGLDAGSALVSWPNDLIAISGTDGSPDTFVDSDGIIHVVNIDPSMSRDAGITGTARFDPASPFPIKITGQRVYGQITIVGQTAFLSTASKAVTDPLQIDPSTTGGAYQLDLGGITSGYSASSLSYFSAQGLYGGVAVFQDSAGTHVMGSQVSQMSQVILSPGQPTNSNPALKVNGPISGLIYQFLSWLRRTLL